LSSLDFCHNHVRNFSRKNLAHRCNKKQGIVRSYSLKRSSFLRERVSVSKVENILKNDVAYIVFLKIGKKPNCYRFVTVFCYKSTLKPAVSHLARTSFNDISRANLNPAADDRNSLCTTQHAFGGNIVINCENRADN